MNKQFRTFAWLFVCGLMNALAAGAVRAEENVPQPSKCLTADAPERVVVSKSGREWKAKWKKAAEGVDPGLFSVELVDPEQTIYFLDGIGKRTYHGHQTPVEILEIREEGALVSIFYRLDMTRAPIQPYPVKADGLCFYYRWMLFDKTGGNEVRKNGYEPGKPYDSTKPLMVARVDLQEDYPIFDDPSKKPPQQWSVRQKTMFSFEGEVGALPGGQADQSLYEWDWAALKFNGQIAREYGQLQDVYVSPERARRQIDAALQNPETGLLREVTSINGETKLRSRLVQFSDDPAKVNRVMEKVFVERAAEEARLRAWEAGAPERQRALAEKQKKEEEERLLRIKDREDAVRKIEEEKARNGLIAIEKVLMEMNEIGEEDQEGGDPRIDAEERRRKEREIKEMIRKMFGENQAEMAE